MLKRHVSTHLYIRGAVAAALLLSFSACGKSDPVYSAISTMGRNYLPYNMNGFTITDAYGNKASGGGDDPPGGGGGVACCYKLMGTEFTVKWDYYDADQWHKGSEEMFRAEAKVSMPAIAVPDKVGTRILELHFYPDRHVEFQFPGGLLDEPRVPTIAVAKWMTRFQPQLDSRYDERDDQQLRRIARVVATAWLRYRMVDQDDLKQFVYFTLLVNKNFDSHPDIQKIVQIARDKPGQFAKAMQALPRSTVNDLNSNRFKAVAVPVIEDGLLPPQRVEDKKNG